jgi:hypothetical protein
MLLVVLEAANLLETRNRLAKRWAQFEKNGGIGKTQYDPQFGSLVSEPFEYLDTLIDSLRISTGEVLSSADAYDIMRLEMILSRTAVLVRKSRHKPNL